MKGIVKHRYGRKQKNCLPRELWFELLREYREGKSFRELANLHRLSVSAVDNKIHEAMSLEHIGITS